MIDIYQFLKPLSENCFRTEKCLLTVAESLKQKTSIHFIPIMTTDARQQLESFTPAGSRPETLPTVCRVALDFKAAQLEGNKKARSFLMALQQALVTNNQSYSHELVIAIAKTTQLNVPDFISNRQTKETIRAVIKEQQLAQQLMPKIQAGVAIDVSTPSQTTVLTDCSAKKLVSAFTPHLTQRVTPDILLQNLSVYAH